MWLSEWRFPIYFYIWYIWYGDSIHIYTSSTPEANYIKCIEVDQISNQISPKKLFKHGKIINFDFGEKKYQWFEYDGIVYCSAF